MSSPKAKTKAEREYMSRVAELGCIICQQPAELHHIREMQGMGSKASNYDVIPLCFNHHSAQTPLPFGGSVHKGTKTFEKKYGTQRELLNKTKQLLELRF